MLSAMLSRRRDIEPTLPFSQTPCPAICFQKIDAFAADCISRASFATLMPAIFDFIFSFIMPFRRRFTLILRCWLSFRRSDVAIERQIFSLRHFTPALFRCHYAFIFMPPPYADIFAIDA